MTEKTKRQKYTKEFKADTIKLVLEQGYSCAEAGRRLGLHSTNVSRWIREQHQDEKDIAEGGVTRRELEEEVLRLRKENKRLEMEREILKKAAAFFAKESS